MRFPGFGFSSPGRSAPSFRLSCPLGEKRVVISLADEGRLRLRSKGGEASVLEEHDVGSVSWQACVLPSREHALCLRVADGGRQRPAVRELLLRAKSREQVQQAVQQLAEHARRAVRSHDGELEPAALEARLLAAVVQCPVPSRPSATPPPRLLAQKPEEPEPRSLSFGSPVVEGNAGAGSSSGGSRAAGCGDAAGEDSRADSPEALLEELGSDWGSDEEAGGAWDCGDSIAGQRLGFGLATGGGRVAGGADRLAAERGPPLLASRSAPTSPVLPGLPLVARVADAKAAPGRRPSASTPASPTHAEASQAPPPQARLPVRLLSFSGRSIGGGVQSHVQRLEAAVAQLSTELAQSRCLASGGSQAASLNKQPAPGPAATAGAGAAQQVARPVAADGQPGVPPRAASGPEEGPTAGPAAGSSSGRGSKAGGIVGGQQADALLQENGLLLDQQASLQAELVRMQGQLSAAAVDNIRLASQAAAAVSRLAAAADAMRAGQQREHELHASLAAAVGQCEMVGRELAGLSARMESREAQCRELRSAVEALSGDKTVLTAAMTTAQVQLKEATPAGFAAETAELRRQAEAARSEAASARAEAAAAAGKAAEAARREAEAAGHMREAARCMEAAQEGRMAGLAREQQLAGEVRSLRQQLAGRLPEGDPARALQARASELEGANATLQQERVALLGQVQQLSAVGQELSSSCRQLEAGLQAAAKERDSSQAALAQVQEAHAGDRQHWEQQRQQLEASLAAAKERLAGAEEGHKTARAQAEQLQARLDRLREEAQAAAQRAAAREQELQAELRLLAGVEQKAAAARAAAAAAAEVAEAGREQEALRAQAAELAASRAAGALEAAHAHLQEEVRRMREERAAATRDLQLEATATKAEVARLGQELRGAQSAAEEQRRAAEEGRRAAQQAQAQAAAAVAAHSSASQERKELRSRLDRAGVERDRAARERDAAELKCTALQQQCRLLQAVAQGQAVLGSSSGGGGGGSGSSGLHKRGGCKENDCGGLGGVEGLLIKAHRGLERTD